MSDPRDDRAPVNDGHGREEDPVESADAEDGTVSDDAEESTRHDDQHVPDRSAPREDVDPADDQTDRTADPSLQYQESSMSPDSGVRGPTQTRSPTGDGGDRWRHALQYAFDIVSSVVIVALIGALLFATSGVWPPLVAIESPSMEPHIDTGDLVFVMDEKRFAGPGAIGESGVVPARAGEQTGYRTFEGYGDVIIYEPNGDSEATPIIHRAMFWVESGENWYDRADSTGVGGADDCGELANCPAPHAGFITKGDNTVSNKRYDQAMRISEPVKPEWVIGTAEYGVPGLGQVRLLSGEVRSTNVTGPNASTETSVTNAVESRAVTP